LDLSTSTSIHKDDGIIDWAPPKSDVLFWAENPKGPYPTLFRHRWYLDYDQYPQCVADVAGYWAEARILGGVVLFDRRDPDTAQHTDPEAVYFHSDRQDVTYRIYQLLPEQRNALVEYLLAEDPTTLSPLPILGDTENRVRVDPEEPIRETGIYRDIWERKDCLVPSWGPITKDVRSYLEYPTQQDQYEASRRAVRRKMRRRAADRAERARQSET